MRPDNVILLPPIGSNTNTLPGPVSGRQVTRVFSRPTTRLGRWAVGLGAFFVLLFLINSFVFMPMQSAGPWQQMVLPFYGIFMLLCGLASGVASLIAILRQGERSWLVWLPLLPGVLVVFMLIGEFLAPH